MQFISLIGEINLLFFCCCNNSKYICLFSLFQKPGGLLSSIKMVARAGIFLKTN